MRLNPRVVIIRAKEQRVLIALPWSCFVCMQVGDCHIVLRRKIKVGHCVTAFWVHAPQLLSARSVIGTECDACSELRQMLNGRASNTW